MTENPFKSGFLRGLTDFDDRPLSQWAVGNVRLPHSKRCKDFRADTAPWLQEPLDAIQGCEAISICKPTQGGGTTFYEIYLANLIARNPRDVNLMAQSDSDGEDIFRSKVLPTLKASPATAPLIALAQRDDITKNRLDLTNGHSCSWSGLNSMQSRSSEVLLLDECWRYAPGVIGQILERTSASEATRKIVAVSQAGEFTVDKHGREILDEWGQWWTRGSQEEYRVQCPACSEFYYPLTSHFRCDPSSRDPETRVWNWEQARKTTHHVTPCCGHIVPNTDAARRSLAASGQYFQTNFNATPRHRSFRYSAWVVYWQNWGGLLADFLRAHEARRLGNIEPYRNFVQKKEAQWWRESYADIPVSNNRPPSLGIP